jgi:hypothetical protein
MVRVKSMKWSKTELSTDEILCILVLTVRGGVNLAVIMQSGCRNIMHSWNLIVARVI